MVLPFFKAMVPYSFPKSPVDGVDFQQFSQFIDKVLLVFSPYIAKINSAWHGLLLVIEPSSIVWLLQVVNLKDCNWKPIPTATPDLWEWLPVTIRITTQ
jgi:hypothetical protein